MIACEHDVVFSLPLSGGYVGPVLWPRWRASAVAALALESALESAVVAAVRAVGAAPALCWRYFLVARRRHATAAPDRPQRTDSVFGTAL